MLEFDKSNTRLLVQEMMNPTYIRLAGKFVAN